MKKQHTLSYWTSVQGLHNAKEICSDLNKMLGRVACRIASKQGGGVYFLDLVVNDDEVLKYDIESDFMLNY